MKILGRVSQFFIPTLGIFPLVVIGLMMFGNSWQKAIFVGALVYALVILGMLLLTRLTQSKTNREQIKEYGEIVLAGETLIFRYPRKPAVSVAATEMLELRYEFNLYGWDSANSFRLIYIRQGKKEILDIAQTNDHLESALRSWCVTCFPNFDIAAFDSVRGLPGGNEPDIVLWSRHTNTNALSVKPAGQGFTHSILFYAVDKPYGCFSNFAPYPVVIDGLLWPTTEHYFQASKMIDPRDREEIRSASTPFIAAQLGRQKTRQIRADWEAVKESEMVRALRNKFEQHEDLKDILRSTAGAHLVEHTLNDSYWGDGGNGSGQNRLGLALELVRAELSPPQNCFYAPPWVIYPDIEASDILWRMGQGEDYLTQSANWKSNLPTAALREYEAYFPTPTEWCRSW